MEGFAVVAHGRGLPIPLAEVGSSICSSNGSR